MKRSRFSNFALITFLFTVLFSGCSKEQLNDPDLDTITLSKISYDVSNTVTFTWGANPDKDIDVWMKWTNLTYSGSDVEQFEVIMTYKNINENDLRTITTGRQDITTAGQIPSSTSLTNLLYTKNGVTVSKSSWHMIYEPFLSVKGDYYNANCKVKLYKDNGEILLYTESVVDLQTRRVWGDDLPYYDCTMSPSSCGYVWE